MSKIRPEGNIGVKRKPKNIKDGLVLNNFYPINVRYQGRMTRLETKNKSWGKKSKI